VAAGSSLTAGRSPYKMAAVGALALTAASTFLVWTSSNSGVETWGLGHNDGFVVVIGSVVGIVLATKAIKAAWIAPGFVAVVQMRDISRVRSTDFDVGIGLWLGLGLALLATILLIADLIFGIQEAARTEQQDQSA